MSIVYFMFDKDNNWSEDKNNLTCVSAIPNHININDFAEDGYMIDSKAVFNYSYEIKFTGINGKKIEKIERFSVGTGTTLRTYLPAEDKTVTIKDSTQVGTSLLKIYFRFSLVDDVPGYKVTTNLTDCTVEGLQNSYKDGDTCEFTLKAKNATYNFDDIQSINIMNGENIETFPISERLKDSVNMSFMVSGDISITAKSVQRKYIVIKGTFENCSFNYENNETASRDKLPIIKPNAGYNFESGGNYLYVSPMGMNYNLILQGTNLTAEKPEWDKQFATIAESIRVDDIEFRDNYKAVKNVEKLTKLINAYNPTKQELDKLSEVRFYQNGGELKDYAEYITQLYITPFNISEIVTESANIILGVFDSKIQSAQLSTYKYIVDGGTITVPEKYKNAYDYENTGVNIVLPFFGRIALNIEDVINHSIHIEYILDMYSGSVTLNIYSDFGNSIIETRTQSIKTDIPFINRSNQSIIGNISSINVNNIDTAFIEVIRNIPYFAHDSNYGHETIYFGQIKSGGGYIECDKITLNTSATQEEKEEIINLLESGVFVYEND